MNRAQLVEHLARDLDVSKALANRFVDSFAEAIYKQLNEH